MTRLNKTLEERDKEIMRMREENKALQQGIVKMAEWTLSSGHTIIMTCQYVVFLYGVQLKYPQVDCHLLLMGGISSLNIKH